MCQVVVGVIKMSSGFYSREFDLSEKEDKNDLLQFINEGKPVILVKEMSDLFELQIDESEIKKA